MVDLEEPVGWTTVSLVTEADSVNALHVYYVQVAVISNHQNGRDTHVRLVSVYGPRSDPHQAMLGLPCALTTTAFSMNATVR